MSELTAAEQVKWVAECEALVAAAEAAEAAKTSLNNDPLPPPRIRLGSKLAIRKTLARLIRETMDGKRDSAELGRLTNALSVLFSFQTAIDRESGGEDEMDPYDEQTGRANPPGLY